MHLLHGYNKIWVLVSRNLLDFVFVVREKPRHLCTRHNNQRYRRASYYVLLLTCCLFRYAWLGYQHLTYSLWKNLRVYALGVGSH
jgi:hypothetical protein